MPEATIPRKRSLEEWSYLFRRENVLRAVRHPALTPAAKQVLVALSLADDDPTVLPARPPVRALARHLALAERTVRQAIAELVEQVCLTFRETGAFFRPGEGAPTDPAARPDLAREWAFLAAARAAPSRAEYLDTLANLRDRAVAAKRIATAVAAERALGRALLEGEQMRRAPELVEAEDEAPLGAPAAANLVLVGKVNADRALAPAARHVLIELILDRASDPVEFPEDDRDKPWSQRIARRHGITVRGARKALAELEDNRLIAQSKGDVCVYESRIAERMRRGTDAPSRLPLCEGLDPLQAHRHRLERLRDLALEQGLVSTALSAHKAIGRVLGIFGPQRNRRAAPAPAQPPAPVPAPPPRPTAPPAIQAQVLPVIRNILDIDPQAGPVMLEVLRQIRAEESLASAKPATLNPV